MTAETIRPVEIQLGITEDMEAECYHAQKWAVSNSDLKVFGGDSPAHYKAMLDGAPEDDSDLTDDERKSRVMGTLVHLAILEPGSFSEGKSHYVKPATYKDEKGKEKPWNGNATVCKDWLAMHDELPVISAKEHRRIVGARDAVLSHPVAGPLLTGPGTNEASVFAIHPDTGIHLRMRADRLTEDADGRPWIVDLKSCPSVKKFRLSAAEYRYDVQSVFYTDVLALAGTSGAAFCFIAFELAPRYGIHAVRVVMPDHDTTTTARKLYEAELESLKKCRETNTWRERSTEIETLTVKRWTE